MILTVKWFKKYQALIYINLKLPDEYTWIMTPSIWEDLKKYLVN